MLISLLILVIISNASTTKQDKSVLYSRIAIQGLLLTTYISYTNLFIKPLDKGIGIYNGLFNVTTFTQSFNILIIVIASLIIILTAFFPRTIYDLTTNKLKNHSNLSLYSRLSVNINSNQFMIIEYALIIIFILCGAVFLMSTGDLISLFLSIELQSYGLYILATLYRDSESATGSGLMYFLLGGLSSCFILLGSAILYVNSGNTTLDNFYIINSINELINTNNINSEEYSSLLSLNYINFSLIVLTVGFLFKVSAAPFHFWSPDVYDGIPTIVTTFVAIIAKISIFTILLELVSYTDLQELSNNIGLSSLYEWKNILVLSSLMSLVIGSLLGLTQYRIKRLFAYSTISHVGFILLALCVNKAESIQGYIFYIMQYSLSNLNAFFILVVIGYTLYDYVYTNNSLLKGEKSITLIDAKNSPVQLLNQLKGYFHINSFLAISFAITLFSFVGIPPLIGFFAKQMVLSAALDEGYVFMTLVAVITSVIGAVYYLNIVKLIFFSKSDIISQYDIKALTLPQNKDFGPVSANVNKLEDVDFTNHTITTVNVGLSTTISVLTMITVFFIFIPSEWFRIVSIISLPLCN